eukprot:9534097-Karenia_brevis.AAC.1
MLVEEWRPTMTRELENDEAIAEYLQGAPGLHDWQWEPINPPNEDDIGRTVRILAGKRWRCGKDALPYNAWLAAGKA